MCVLELTPVLESRRLILRSPEAIDQATLVKQAVFADQAQAKAFVVSALAADPAEQMTFVVLMDSGMKSGGIPIGWLRLDARTNPKIPRATLLIAPTFRNRGFGTEALTCALNWVRTRWRKRAVTARHAKADAAMATMLINAGFLYTGSVRAPVRELIWLA